MEKEKIIIIGGGGHAKACIDVIESCKQYEIIGYLDRNSILNEKYNIPYLGDDQESGKYIGLAKFLVCVGQIKNANIRENIYQQLSCKSAEFATIISPTAYVSKYAKVGKGSIIMHGALLQADVVVGNNCIINDYSLVEHDSVVGNNCHISTGAKINGGVNIGNNVFIGSGAIIKNGVTIANNAIVGMGSVVVENIEESQIIFGNPAKKKLNAK